MFSFPRSIFRGLLAICLWLVALEATAQSSNPYIPNVVPASPDAAVMMKFGDVPISPYTGTADVNVPIYNIQVKGLSLPIGLDYHTGGVKVKEEATWVGLGWNLSPGGMISRTINDHDDFGTGSLAYFTNQVPQPDADMAASQPYLANTQPNLGSYIYDFFCTYTVGTSNGNYDYTNAFNGGTAMYDMEPDLFNYDIPGHSGKFIITRAGNVVLQKQENIRIQFPSNGSSFTITDDQGNKYYFGVHDQTPSPSNELSATVWYMTKIVTQQNDSIVFNYTTGGYNIKSPLNQYFNSYCSATAGPVTTQGVPTTYTCQTLNSIDFPTGHLTFQWDVNRSDMQGGAKLDSVLIYSKSSTGALTYQKQFNFNYSYFNFTTPTPVDSFELYRLRLDSVKEKTATSSLPPYSFVYNNITSSFKCIKDSFDVDHWGYFNAAANSSLIPTINVGYAPPGNAGVQSFFTYAGANRDPNPTFMVAFSLQQVNYPTGGKTVFNYQPNDYDYQKSVTGPQDFQYEKLVNVDSIVNVDTYGTTSGTINLNYIQPILPTGSPQSNLTIHLTFRYQNNNDFTYTNSSNKLTFNFSGGNGAVNLHEDINEATCQPNSPVCTIDIPVTIAPIGVYNWSAYIDPSVNLDTSFSEIELNFQYSETQQDYNLLNNNSFISPASGLRIQSVLNYSDANTIASEKVYTYGYSADLLGTGTPQSYSYGKLMAFPSYVRYAIVPGPSGSHCDQLSLFSSSYTALSSVIQGNIVGYDQVTETSVDPSTGKDIGKTVYSYFNSPDSSVSYSGFRFPGCFSLGNSLSGTLLSKVTYANNNGAYNKITETDDYYHTTNRNVYFSPKYSFAGTQTPTVSECSFSTSILYEVMACFYPSIKSERTLLDSSTEIFYQQLDTTKALVKTTAYYYDNPVHYQVTRTRSIDSKGNRIVDRSRYPQDYIPNGNTVTGNTILDSMIGRNMVSGTIEKADSLYYAGSSSGFVTDAQLNLYRILPVQNNTIGADRVYKLDVQAPVTNFQPFAISGNTTSKDSRYEQKISFDHYDKYSNIVQYTPEDGVVTSFLWDYTGHYPIAKVVAGDSLDVAYTSFEADGSGNWQVPSTARDTGSITGSACYNLTSGSISKSGLTAATTYIVSFWMKTGSVTVSGSTSHVTGKTISGWTYNEYTVTGTTTETVSGSGDIDELRLYPSTAQMTTFTYSPLVGVTSQCDVNNRVSYYSYDGFGRLLVVKDQDGNIIKTYQYHYKGQTK
jgi:YD repeat-containing protein